MTRDLPPWEPIADWLVRISDDGESLTPVSERREAMEPTAKAIAYDIAMHGSLGDCSVEEQQRMVGSDDV